MKKTIIRETPALCLALLLSAVVLAGCQSGKFSHYISPRVTGRVLAADTGKPLAGASVQRVRPVETTGEGTPPKGCQLLTQPSAKRTDTDGRFVLESENVVTPFRHRGWNSVTVTFGHSGYNRLQTNFTIASFKERSAAGEPLVNAGDILLQPVAK